MGVLMMLLTIGGLVAATILLVFAVWKKNYFKLAEQTETADVN
jgi:hypothetical protein